MQTAPFSFRGVRPEDLGVLREWHRRPHVLQFWPDPPEDQDLQDYCEPGLDRTPRFNLALLGLEPVGFIQWYRAVEGHAEGWWREEFDPGVRGIDQFLADAQRLNSGLGTRMVRAFTQVLFEDPGVSRIQVDPHPDNDRAIRCYEKAGFRRIREVATPDGPALLMYLERALEI